MDSDKYVLASPLQVDPPRLMGSHDPTTGQTYFPPRELSVDGKLRRLETVELPQEGVLWSFTRMGKTLYGQVDLPNKVRVLATLAPHDYTIGSPCRLELVAPEAEGGAPGWRFTHA